MPSFSDILSTLSLLGLGSLIGVFLKSYLDRKSNLLSQKHDFKFTRYKCILMLMVSSLDFEKQKTVLKEHGRNFNSTDDLFDELKAEKINMVLFSDEKTIHSLDRFIKNPSQQNLENTANHMRKDLWS
ncbi:MAG: hypothetical protein COX62_02565 [Deltaproteobacteria bacterium CG_4_10_14_0_2_um_filter_43_8]|nr:MAG: hypothetical protein COV43_07055 [Deltaproteobacteria bacterium CG11_big_fil_rev_8_21_14_0_20_42_23]PJA21396.1 MAG: hypothetical protein COX62_02565 [Deltaproteobacteria bacterium CG_4_10_14_0_2_um_filter_43_8]PJC63861.1 MAG: hypothetical protein CO021_07240 [Deltaproteobacteria bacterium CG_4_9_14_0_2_um_filter_42_21]